MSKTLELARHLETLHINDMYKTDFYWTCAMTALSPMVTPCRMVAFEPTHTFLPNTIGAG